MTGEDRRPKIEGVEEVEALYTCFARMVEGDAYHVLKFHGLTERIDLPIVKEGVLPTKAGEVALLSFWARDHGLELGDRIRLKHDGPVEGDRDGMERLTADSFVVTALVEHPAYMSKVAGTLGMASIGAGDIDCAAFVSDESFDAQAFGEGHPSVLIRCGGLRGMDTFGQAYQDALEPLVQAVDELGVVRSDVRLDQLRSTLREQAQLGFDQAQQALDNLEDSDWVETSRLENGGVQNIDTITKTLGKVRWIMALMFVIVGLFVCYTALSRLVYDQAVQIGTKKAGGFHEWEIALGYLSFSTSAVACGTALGLLVAVFVLQPILNPAAAATITVPSYGPHVNLLELLAWGVSEAVLMANGFTTGEAKAYIYRDTLALTAMGIPLGIAFGALMGAATVRALEPSYGSFIKGFNALAALVGAVGATTLSLSVLFVALRRIDRFDLTDVNRL